MSRKKYQIEVGEKFYWSDRRLYHIINIFVDGCDILGIKLISKISFNSYG